MTAKEYYPCFSELVKAAPEDRSNRVSLESVLGKAGDRQRSQRPPTHRIDVAERVRRGNLTVNVRIIDNWREEVDRLHERRPTLPSEHTRIVRCPIVDQDPVVRFSGNDAQHLSELARGEFAHSTSAGDHL